MSTPESLDEANPVPAETRGGDRFADITVVPPVGYQGAAAHTFTLRCDGFHPVGEQCNLPEDFVEDPVLRPDVSGMRHVVQPDGSLCCDEDE